MGGVKPLNYFRRDVDLTNVLTSLAIVDPGNLVSSFWVASMPAGVNAFLRFGQKDPWPLASGLAVDFGDCFAENQGVTITTDAALPGLTITILFGGTPFTLG